MPKKPKAKAKRGRPPNAEKQAAPPMRSAAQQIGVNDFKNLTRRCASLKKQGQTLAGEMGEMIKNAVENKNLDRVAYGIFRKLENMAPEKLATTLACFDYYRDIGGLDEAAEKQAALDIPRQEAGQKENGHAAGRKQKAKAKAAEAEAVSDDPEDYRMIEEPSEGELVTH